MPKKKNIKWSKILKNAVEKIKYLYNIIKGKILVNPVQTAYVTFALILLLSLNFMGSCNTKFLKCDYQYNPNIDKLKEVI